MSDHHRVLIMGTLALWGVLGAGALSLAAAAALNRWLDRRSARRAWDEEMRRG